MAIADKEKELLKQFLTYNLEQDWDNKDNRRKFVEIFGNLVMSDSEEMKRVVLSMFNAFNDYQDDIDNPVDDEEPADGTAEEPTDNTDNVETPTEDELDSQFESVNSTYAERANEMLGWY